VFTRKAFLRVALTANLLLSACGKPVEVPKDMRRTVQIASTTISSEKDSGYRLLGPGEVERFLHDHPEDADRLPELIESSKASLEVEKLFRDYPEDADRLPELIQAAEASLGHPKTASDLPRLIETVRAFLEVSQRDESTPIPNNK
jgi:hypothetical protein